MFVDVTQNKKQLFFGDITKFHKALNPGVYSLEIEKTWMGENLYLEEVNTFKGKVFMNTGIYKKIDDLINIHLSKSMQEAKSLLKLRNKVGLIFNGAPGTGKTFTAGLIAQRIVEKRGGIAIITKDVQGDRDKRIIQKLRSFTDKPIVYIFDEFEKTVKRSDTTLLSLLDGVDSPENIIFIATVNSTEDLPSFIIDRPGRFESIFTFKSDDPIVIKAIIESLLPEPYRDPSLMEAMIKSVSTSKNKTIDKIVLIARDHLSRYLYLKSKEKKQSIEKEEGTT